MISPAVISHAIAAAAGVALGAWVVDGHAQAQVAKLKAAHTEQLLDAESDRLAAEIAASRRLRDEQHKVIQAGAELVQVRQRLASTQTELARRVAHVTTTYRPAPDAPAIALPEPVFTWGFVRVWNAATGACAVPEADAAGRDDATASACQAPGADPAGDLAPSGLSEADILHGVNDYAGRCRGIEAQLGALIDLHRQQDQP